MTSKEIRASFLKYFERHGHRIVASSPLVPHDDPTLLFTNAGMNQFKDVVPRQGDARLHARDHRAEVHARQRQAQRPRQRRAVVPAPHLLRDAGQLLVRRLLQARGDSVRLDAADRGVEAARGSAVCDRVPGEAGIPRDDEAYDIWRTFLPADHIGELGSDDNFWQMGDTGPCGRCSEIYYFRGASLPCAEEAAGRAVPRHRVQLRSLRRDLEQRVHGVRPAAGRHAEPAAGAVDRHRHGPRARHRRAAGEALELRHRPVHAPARRDRRTRRNDPPAARWTRATCRCASSPTTCAR